MPEPQHMRIHATSIAWRGRGALLQGPSGSGKSSVALQLLALGCDLIADDQSEVHRQGDRLLVRCPEQIKGRIEARRFGILPSRSIEEAQLVCAVDLGVSEDQRLPEEHVIEYCGARLRLFHNPGIQALPFMLLHYLKTLPKPT